MTLSRQHIMVSEPRRRGAHRRPTLRSERNFISTETSENGGGMTYAVTLGGSIVLALVLFGWLIPRTERPGRAGLVHRPDRRALARRLLERGTLMY